MGMSAFARQALAKNLGSQSAAEAIETAIDNLDSSVATSDSKFDTTLGTITSSGTAAGAIPANRLVKGHTDGTLLVGTLGSKRIIGSNIGSAAAEAGTVSLGVGYVTGVAAEPILAGDLLKCGDNGRILQVADADNISTVIGTGTAGNFGNQPNNDGVEIVSDSEADVGISITIIGTTTGTDTLVSETLTTHATNGTTQVATTKVNWGYIVAVKTGTHAGTLTIREASANATIIALATGTNSAGVVSVAAAAQGAHGLIPYIKAGGASTKVVGVLYEPATGAADALMAEALNGTTAAPLPAAANLVKEIYLGDVATGTVATVYTSDTEDDEQVTVGKACASITAGASGTFYLRP